MLPLDPDKQDAYRAKLREARARQATPVPKGTRFSDEHRAAISKGARESMKHRSKNQGGEKNSNWKGGGHLDRHGYRVITIGGKQFMEHRLVMEGVLGRKLLSHETVHHKNGVRSDNSSSNLELWNNRHGKGQRVEDRVSFMKDFLSQYGFTVSKPPRDSAWVSGLLHC